MLGLVARRGETIPGDGLGEAIPTLGPRGESHVRLARLASTRLVLISGVERDGGDDARNSGWVDGDVDFLC